ncbi:molybdopterin-binding/glycosyltransferase family 2 protein [Neorhizobium sp. CSC1952]|uniref:molybdopterin-binding/glycosyltransferase family 2 protein n=1 Tax=Neorhizobium sp. CSC1952 TaxID=2978974 RepID=UPI0025A5ED8F|nr:molybdopterin-binding/glycosyltransferase family 2 protein [Rhizobium sp. CSC1952]WJR66665.1 molybdopterin-binding/glycosyltransferase family 2 protein [Rhizobium sp. CSC1952]
MRYGTFELGEAEGTVLAHSIRLPSGRVPKGQVLSQGDIVRLSEEGVASVVAVRLDPGDMLEDEAAATIAGAIAPDNLRFSEATTGRVNIYARVDGLFVADKAVVDALNRIDPAITLACLADHVAVRAGDMVATVKIIPLAVGGDKVAQAVSLLSEAVAFEVKTFRPRAVTLVATELPSLKASVMDRTARLLEQRLAPSGSRLIKEIRIPHSADRLTEVLRELKSREIDEPAMVIVFGASAVADADDVIPAAIRRAGGEVEQVGMPVDPGNLLVLGRIGEVPVLGAPGCARSPKENGFDWVLNRLMAGETPTSFDITGMGVGGLLMEIPTRPRPRDATAEKKVTLSVGALLLAAGQARRMGKEGPHKLLAEFGGVPLVRRSAEVLSASQASPVVAVTGHRREEIEAALAGLDIRLHFNSGYASGMAGSLVTGFSAPELAEKDGILVMLADMPGVTTDHVNMLIAAFREAGGGVVVRSVSEGKRGNPIILPRVAYDAVLRLEGDVGARAIIENSGLSVIDVDIGPAAHLDVDTPEAVTAAGGVLRG